MPFAKGINAPAVRSAWLAERRRKVEAFERLVAGGIPKPHAARAVGSTVTGIKAMRHSIEGLEEGKHVGRSMGAHIDLGLALALLPAHAGREPDERGHGRVVRVQQVGDSEHRAARPA